MLSLKYKLKIYVKMQNIDKIICADLRVDMLCIWWHRPNGGGTVVPAGCDVLYFIFWTCI